MSGAAQAHSASARTLAGNAVLAVMQDGISLSQSLPEVLAQASPVDRALVQELTYGALRWRFRLEAQLGRLLKQPLKRKDQDIVALLLIGLYQLAYMNTPAHAAVHATVEAVRATGKRWAVPLANAVLRNYQRRHAELDAAVAVRPAECHAHPDWLVDQLRRDWPQDWESLLAANNARPPMTLRVNPLRGSVEDYRAQLQAAGLAHVPLRFGATGLCLEQAVSVERLPGFEAGRVSVQDAAAQLAAPLLETAPGMRVLDACAAPGGKTAHILECTPQLAELIAVDADADRARRIDENLLRLGLTARVLIGDAAQSADWWDGRPFDRILLDAPCSATGVIRRHPDIKSLRHPGDIDALAATQARLLDALWPLLAPGGMLLYATCSVLHRENEQQIAAFLQRQSQAQEQRLIAEWGRAVAHGRQILPGQAATADGNSGMGMDGFYFAALIKRSDGG
ncbi:MAG TPA: 16S rRNA (cytosine(967)-C(5))-methyltransferase RsmB [Gammaproteobacteria bacterium]